MKDEKHDFWERPIPPEEFERRLNESLAALEGPAGDEMREMIAWFRRRYPTPLGRLAYIRRKTREIEKLRGRLGAK